MFTIIYILYLEQFCDIINENECFIMIKYVKYII